MQIIKRIRRARQRQIMRGYRFLKQSGGLERITSVKAVLTETPLGLYREHFSPVVMGAGVATGEVVVRQYLLLRIGGINLNRALLLALGKKGGRVSFPLPKLWRSVLEQHGFEVSHFRSSLFWQLYICALFCYGILQIGKIALAGMFWGRKEGLSSRGYAYFSTLTSGNLPQQIDGGRSRDVISWYLQWRGKRSDVEAIHHSAPDAVPVSIGGVQIIPQRGSLPALPSMLKVLAFVLWSLRAILSAFFDCFRGRWWHALLLNQAALAAQVRFLPVSALAKEYLFHNSGWMYRPLWTYEAERRGSSILFYFYSTNCEVFKKADFYPPMNYGWRAMSWPRYLVWDEYQADFVRRAVGDFHGIDIVQSIWFHSSAANLPELPKKTIAVFDVQPMRDGFYRTLGQGLDYYVPAVAIQFLADIQDVLRDSGYAFAVKRKRQIGKLAHPAYRRYMDSLDKVRNCFSIDPGIDAYRLIEECTAVISMPFTSTALLGRELGKPSVYYDPLALLQKDDRAAHGIEVLQGKEDLLRWLNAIEVSGGRIGNLGAIS